MNIKIWTERHLYIKYDKFMTKRTYTSKDINIK